MQSPRNPLLPVTLVILAGILAGAQLGKVAPLIPWYVETVGLSLTAAGWLTAVLGLFVALVAMPVGWLIGRFGALRATLAASAALVAGGVVLAAVADPAAIFGARLVEALGYVVLCISLPAILNEISPPAWRGPVLAIWSGFVPLGYAASDFLALALLPTAGPHGFLLVVPLLYGVVWMAAWAVLPRLGEVRASAANPVRLGAALTTPVLLVTGAFGAFVVLSVAFLTFLPTFAAVTGSLAVSAGVVALTVPVGNFAAGALVQGRGARYMAGLGMTGFLLCALAAPAAFGGFGIAVTTAGAIALAVASALVASTVFAAVPLLVADPRSVPTAFGIVSQAGGLGTLAGPPIAAMTIAAAGWPALGWFLAAAALAGVALLAPLVLRERRMA